MRAALLLLCKAVLSCRGGAAPPASSSRIVARAEAQFTLWSPPVDVSGLGADTTSSDGRLVARAEINSAVVAVIDTATLTRRFFVGFAGGVEALSISPDGSLLASHETVEGPEKTGVVRVFRIATGEPLAAVFDAGLSARAVLTFAPDGKTLLSSDKIALTLRDVPSGHARARLELPPTELGWQSGDVVFRRDFAAIELRGKYGDTSRAVLLVDVRRGALLAAPFFYDAWYHRNGPSFVLSPDGRTLAVRAASPSGVELWDLARGERLGELRDARCRPGRFLLSMAFDERGERLAEGRSGDEVCVWNVAARSLIRRIEVPALPTRKPPRGPDWWQGMVTTVAFVPGGKGLFVGEHGESVALIELTTGRTRRLAASFASDVRVESGQLEVLEERPNALTRIAPDLTIRTTPLAVPGDRPRFEDATHIQTTQGRFDLSSLRAIPLEACDGEPCVHDAEGHLRARFAAPTRADLVQCRREGHWYPRERCPRDP